LLLAACSLAAAQDDSLQRFLQKYASDAGVRASDDHGTRYIAKFVQLRDGSRQEVIVYLMGSDWCGTGGCDTLILVPENSSYTIVAEIGIVHPPIRVLDTKSHGWRDIGVWVAGGDIQPGYETRLRFDGTGYPGNPTVPPAEPLAARTKGTIAISGDETGKRLYP
jgi:hypothetical protein